MTRRPAWAPIASGGSLIATPTPIKNVVQNGPLYPLNSLMLHGMIYAQHHRDLDKDPGNDFRNEVRSYFGTGTQLQEMYITPSLLTAGKLGRSRRGGEVVAHQRRSAQGYALGWRRSGVA